jgi:hypothetical protein
MPHCKAKLTALAEAHATGYILHRRRTDVPGGRRLCQNQIFTAFQQEYVLLAIILAAGWPIWPLLIASIIGLALVIERLVYLRRPRILPPDLLGEVVGSIRADASTTT